MECPHGCVEQFPKKLSFCLSKASANKVSLFIHPRKWTARGRAAVDFEQKYAKQSERPSITQQEPKATGSVERSELFQRQLNEPRGEGILIETESRLHRTERGDREIFTNWVSEADVTGVTIRKMNQYARAQADGRRFYVEPERMREHMIELFDRQIEEQRELDEESVCFLPDRVEYDLGVPFTKQLSEVARISESFRRVLDAVHEYSTGCCYYGMQRLPEDEEDEDLLIIDPWIISAECTRADGTDATWSKAKEVYRTVRRLSTVYIGEHRNRLSYFVPFM
jgi:hypothetical protein